MEVRLLLPEEVLVEQSGVLATLSRWRSWVQIPSGTLAQAATGPGGGTGRHAALRTPCLRAWEVDSPLGHLGKLPEQAETEEPEPLKHLSVSAVSSCSCS